MHGDARPQGRSRGHGARSRPRPAPGVPGRVARRAARCRCGRTCRSPSCRSTARPKTKSARGSSAEEDLAGNELEAAARDVARAHRALPRTAHPSEPARRSRCAASTRCRSGAPPDANWFELSFEERKELMGGHARVGRTYAGRVLQLITGSTGIDDWEWGVTLLADDVVALKEIVYEMRFDPVSARYADFGPFFTGLVLPAADACAAGRAASHDAPARDPAVRLLPRGARRTGPMIYELVKQFDVVPNLRRANVESHSGWMILELSGAPERPGRRDRLSRGPGLHREPHGRRRRRRVDQPAGTFCRLGRVPIRPHGLDRVEGVEEDEHDRGRSPSTNRSTSRRHRRRQRRVPPGGRVDDRPRDLPRPRRPHALREPRGARADRASAPTTRCPASR